MIENMTSLVVAASVVLPVAVIAHAAAWRRDVAPTSGIAARARAFAPKADRLVTVVPSAAATFGYDPQSRGSCR